MYIFTRKDVSIFTWKYSFYDLDLVVNERWLKSHRVLAWLPNIFHRDPLPIVTALWARTAEIGVSIVFVTISLTASLLFEELSNRAEMMAEEKDHLSMLELDDWRRHYDRICTFVKKTNRCFGPILVLQTALGFAMPIFEFAKILQTKGQSPRLYFEFIHTIFRFFVIILIPPYLVTQQVNSPEFIDLY